MLSVLDLALADLKFLTHNRPLLDRDLFLAYRHPDALTLADRAVRDPASLDWVSLNHDFLTGNRDLDRPLLRDDVLADLDFTSLDHLLTST